MLKNNPVLAMLWFLNECIAYDDIWARIVAAEAVVKPSLNSKAVHYQAHSFILQNQTSNRAKHMVHRWGQRANTAAAFREFRTVCVETGKSGVLLTVCRALKERALWWECPTGYVDQQRPLWLIHSTVDSTWPVPGTLLGLEDWPVVTIPGKKESYR